MRAVLILSLAPGAMLFGWYWLSLADVGEIVGGVYLSREANEGVFLLLGGLLQVSPDRLPGMLASGIATDAALLLGFLAFRRRRALAARYAGLHSPALSRASPRYDRAPPAE
ncbi:DUF6105 family protein [Jiella avicenniae]|uniref:DUF6105 family protein n=1 Tax=Jiella avicenniae TaxID=2907202 RepID=A0A9X1T4X1_9HYPH|nr:DUF6105 family protein [Jiella avicenniae]MCE7028239.1 DUF6105 family protein [Jiella avicenniae]